MNVADLIIIIAILLIVFMAVKKMIKNKRMGKCNCGCSDCSACSNSKKKNSSL